VALVGVLPGLAAARLDLVPALRRESAASRGRRRLETGDLLVVAQVAVSVALLAAASLLVGRFRELAATDDGFDADAAVQASYDVGLQDYSEERAVRFHAELLRRAEERLGARQVAITDWTPLRGGWSRTSIGIPGYEPAPGEVPNADVAVGSPALFDVLGLRLVGGRALTAADAAGSQPVAVINETMARRYFAGRDPLGATFEVGSRAPSPIVVVGVVADARYRDLRGPVMPMFFRPLAQSNRATSSLAVVARSEQPATALAELRAIFRDLDPELPLFRAERLAEQAVASLRPERTAAALFSGFATLVLILATAGVGALSLAAVARRRREIGVRVALGALPTEVVRLLLSRVGGLLTAGFALGLACAAAISPWLSDVAACRLGSIPRPWRSPSRRWWRPHSSPPGFPPDAPWRSIPPRRCAASSGEQDFGSGAPCDPANLALRGGAIR
jgi:hypothetical protein